MVDVNGQRVNARTIAMLAEVERLTGTKLTVIKGQQVADASDPSAGTHDGYGVVDLRTKYFTVAVRQTLYVALRRVGFAAWYRTVAQGFSGPHFHCVAMGDPDLSGAARKQVTAYRNGHNGLKNNGPDDGPKGFTRVTWESYLKAHPPEETVSPEQMTTLLNAIDKSAHKWAVWGALFGVETEDERAAARGAWDAAIKAGKTEEEAAAAASAKMSGIRAGLKKSQAEL